MTYLLIKSLHLCAVLFWISGLFMFVLLLLAGRDLPGPVLPLELSRLRTLRRWCQHITVPAMLLTWLSGLTLAAQGGWVGATWLSLKLVCVLSLSVLHAGLSGFLRRRMEHPTDTPPARLVLIMPSLMIVAAAIVFLVVNKPF
jgi:uncharacterized membrane protein